MESRLGEDANIHLLKLVTLLIYFLTKQSATRASQSSFSHLWVHSNCHETLIAMGVVERAILVTLLCLFVNTTTGCRKPPRPATRRPSKIELRFGCNSCPDIYTVEYSDAQTFYDNMMQLWLQSTATGENGEHGIVAPRPVKGGWRVQ